MRKIIETIQRKWAEYLLEVIVIVGSILGAFALDTWNEERKENKKSDFFLSEINKEFKENKKQWQITQDNLTKILKNCEAIVSQFPMNLNNADSLIHLYVASMEKGPGGIERLHTFDPSYSSLKSVLNSGSIDLIKNKNLVKLLIRWPDVYIDYKEAEIRFENFVLSQLKPFTINNFKSAYQVNYFVSARLESNKWFVFENLLRERLSNVNHFNIDPMGEYKKLNQIIDSIIYYTEPYVK